MQGRIEYAFFFVYISIIKWNIFMEWLTILWIAIGLGMDAFAVSLAVCACGHKLTPRATFRLPFHFLYRSPTPPSADSGMPVAQSGPKHMIS